MKNSKLTCKSNRRLRWNW